MGGNTEKLLNKEIIENGNHTPVITTAQIEHAKSKSKIIELLNGMEHHLVEDVLTYMQKKITDTTKEGTEPVLRKYTGCPPEHISEEKLRIQIATLKREVRLLETQNHKMQNLLKYKDLLLSAFISTIGKNWSKFLLSAEVKKLLIDVQRHIKRSEIV